MYGKHRADAEAQQQDQAYQMGQANAMAAVPAQAPSAGPTNDDITRLQQLGKLHEDGVLTDEEFARQKASILGP